MASSTIRSVHVAEESTFARIAAASGVPSAAGASFAPLEFEGASLSLDSQSHEANEMDQGRGSAYHLAPEPVTMLVSGSRVRRRTGTVSLRIPWRGIGSSVAYGTYSAMPAGRLVSSGGGVLTPATTSDAVSAAAATANNTQWTPTAIASFPEDEIGAGVACDVAGRKEFSFITDRVDASPDLVKVSPGFTTDLTNASSHVVWNCLTIYAALGVTSPLGASVTLRLDGDGWRTYCYGGRAESMSWTLSNRCLYLDVVVRFAVIQDDHASATTVSDPTRASGQIAHALGSYVRMTGAIGSTTPAELAATTYGADDWSFTWTNTLSGRGHSDDLAGISDWEITDVTATASVTLAVPSTDFDAFFLNRTEFSVLLGCGPAGQGEGACFYLPAAHLTSDASVRDLGGERVRQVLNLRNGGWFLDDNAGTATAADSSARMAFPLKTA